jgi:hypothetical protein
LPSCSAHRGLRAKGDTSRCSARDGCKASGSSGAGSGKTVVWRWQERFMTDGVAGLLRDKTRPSRIPPLEADVAARVVAATQIDPPGETTH